MVTIKIYINFAVLNNKNYKSYEDGINSLNMANQAISKGRLEGDIPSVLEEITRFNFNWMNEIRENYNNKDFGYVFEKYINN